MTWDAPRHVPVNPGIEMCISEPAIELADGTLLFPGYAYVGEGEEASFISRSTDGGDTWSVPTPIAHDRTGTIDFSEPALLDLGDGHILCVLRAADHGTPPDRSAGSPIGETWEEYAIKQYSFMFQTHSWDNGETWEAYERTPIWGHPPNLIQLSDGRALCTYGYRREPYGIRASFSHDQGRTWDIAHEVVLRTDGGGRDLGYPSSVELPDGSILSAYYFHTESDTTRRIEATKWQPSQP